LTLESERRHPSPLPKRRVTPTTCSVRCPLRRTTIRRQRSRRSKDPLLAIDLADDLINPPELQILEREIKRVPKGKAILVL